MPANYKPLAAPLRRVFGVLAGGGGGRGEGSTASADLRGAHQLDVGAVSATVTLPATDKLPRP